MKAIRLLAIGLLAFAGCGSGGESSSATGGSSTTGGSGGGGAGGSCAGGAGGAPTGDWACVGAFVPPTATTNQITFSLTPQTAAPINGITVKACLKSDESCVNPVASGTTNTGEEVAILVPIGESGFDGYLEWSGPGLQTTLEFFFPSFVEDWSSSLLLFPTSYIDSLTQSIGVQLEPQRGILAFQAWDCARWAASGVTMSTDAADEGTSLAYFVDGPSGPVPSKSATTTDEAAFGLGAFLNVPAGPATLTATLASTCQTLGSVSVFVRAGAITAPSMGPLQ